MKKYYIFVTAVLCSVFTIRTTAQSDTSYLDAGRIQLDKNFTQTISIKGEDLEKIPFSSLQEAIDVWLYGIYSNKSTLSYVIDGIVVNDVNAYSIHDIESITLVQNALAQMNGADRQQQLVLITTRRGKAGAKGITAAGNTAYLKSEHFYHNYYLSAFNNKHRVQYGLSANYLHDATGEDIMTTVYSNKLITAPNFNRFRFNGYATTVLGKHHELSLLVNYAPQNSKTAQESVNYFVSLPNTLNQTFTTGEYTLSTRLQVKSAFGNHWRNEFNAMYFTGDLTYNGAETYVKGSSAEITYEHAHTDINNIILKDHVSYHKQVGNWSFTPALNAQFSFPKYLQYIQSVTIINQFPQSGIFTSTRFKGKSYLLTPSLAIAYKNIVQMQGGILYNVSPAEGRSLKRVFPFATLTTDVLKAVRSGSPASLQVFGSYSQYDNFADLQYRLSDFTYGQPPTPYVVIPGYGPTVPFLQQSDQQYRNWQTGVRFKTGNGRLELNYNFEKRDYTTEVIVPIPAGSNINYILIYPDMRAYAHNIGLRAAVIQSNNVSWMSGIQATTIRNKTTTAIGNYIYADITGDFRSTKNTWVGGFTNRFRYKALSAGADIQYVFNQHYLTTTTQPAKTQLLLQNVYVAYQLQSSKFPLELYVSCRNLGDSKNTAIVVRDKFYSVGFKVGL